MEDPSSVATKESKDIESQLLGDSREEHTEQLQHLQPCSHHDVFKVSMRTREKKEVTIFRLPSWFHEKSKELCEPKIVSIGPFHHGKESLRPMEEYKESTLLDFLARNKNVTKEYYLDVMRSLEAEARQCYSEKVKMTSDEFAMMLLLDGCFILEWFTKHKLDEVDVVYGGGGWATAIFSDMCLLENQLPFFVIHKLKAICDGVDGSQNCKGIFCPLVTSRIDRVRGSQNGEGVDICPTLTSGHDGVKESQPATPTSSQNGEGINICPTMTSGHDGVKESQPATPTSVDELVCLNRIKKCGRICGGIINLFLTMGSGGISMLSHSYPSSGFKISTEGCCPLLEETFKHLPPQFKFRESIVLRQITDNPIKIKHLLHFYYLVVLMAPINPQPDTNEETRRSIEPTNIRCVAELQDAGVTFKERKGDCNLLDITFDKGKGTILMPSLLIQNDILTILWNMVAFEQSYHQKDYPRILSSYLALMDALIDTEKDVTSLERCGILKNFFPTTEEAAQFFNQFSSNFWLDYREHYFYELFKQVNEYSGSTWHKHRARLMQDYFSNPWSIISVVVAAILLALTVLQTYYSAPK